MAAKLVAEEGTLEGLVLAFEEGNEWVIGRDPESCQLLVEDPEVSRRHLLARESGEGIILENLSTTNPALVNDQALTKPRLLQHGDTVKIGTGLFRFYTEIGSPEIQELEEGEGANGEEDEEETEEEAEAMKIAEVEQKELLSTVDFGLEESGRFVLKVIAGPNSGAEFSMEPGRSYTLGTAPTQCDVVFQDASVSRQHARLTIGGDGRLVLEDLGSKNGTQIDSAKIKGKTSLPLHAVVSVGTTSFIVYDREGEQQTIITPLLPSILKTLQKDEAQKAAKKTAEKKPGSAAAVSVPTFEMREKKSRPKRALVLFTIVALLLAGIGIGTSTLFKSEEIVAPEVDIEGSLAQVMQKVPSIQYSYNKASSRLLLVGHLLNGVDRSQLLYALQALPFVKSVDDSNVIIDEYVLREYNQILAKNPTWRGVTIHASEPGHYVLNGYLKTRKQAEQLGDYMVQNFPYLDLLDRKIIVEEEELTGINVRLQERGFRDLNVEMNAGELTISGTTTADKDKELAALIEEFKKNPAIRVVKNFVVQLEPRLSIVDISDTYRVTGSSNQGGANLNVVINGRILMKGDILDGMTITDITRNQVLLEREGVKYKIDYNK